MLPGGKPQKLASTDGELFYAANSHFVRFEHTQDCHLVTPHHTHHTQFCHLVTLQHKHFCWQQHPATEPLAEPLVSDFQNTW